MVFISNKNPNPDLSGCFLSFLQNHKPRSLRVFVILKGGANEWIQQNPAPLVFPQNINQGMLMTVYVLERSGNGAMVLYSLTKSQSEAVRLFVILRGGANEWIQQNPASLVFVWSELAPTLERVTGFEPVSPAWKAGIIALIRYPLSYSYIINKTSTIKTRGRKSDLFLLI